MKNEEVLLRQLNEDFDTDDNNESGANSPPSYAGGPLVEVTNQGDSGVPTGVPSEPLTPRKILTNARLYVRNHFEEGNYHVDAIGEIKGGESSHSIESMFHEIYLDCKEKTSEFNRIERQKDLEAAAQNPDKKKQSSTIFCLSKDELKFALLEHIKLSKDLARKRSIESLRCEKEDLSQLSEFVAALNSEYSEIHQAVFAQHIATVKRKQRDLSHKYEMVIVITGPQKCGKSTAVKLLASPLRPHVMDWRFSELTDSRNIPALSENYLAILDEMERADRTEIASVKNRVTADTVSYRELYSHTTRTVPQRCSFICLSNKPLIETITDSTGMRRWVEIKVNKIDWTRINKIDYVALWKGVDESKEDSYILPVLDALELEQTKLVVKDEIEQFVSESGIEPHNSSSAEGKCYLATSDLYEAYSDWASKYGFATMNNSWFGRKLSRFDLKTEVIQKKNYYILNFEKVSDSILKSYFKSRRELENPKNESEKNEAKNFADIKEARMRRSHG